MSFLRSAFLAPRAIGSQGLRSISSSATSSAQNAQNGTSSLLDLLSDEPTPRSNTLRSSAQSESQSDKPGTLAAKARALLTRKEATAPSAAARNAEIQRSHTRSELEKQMTRRWKGGDVYAPHDLSGMEMRKWRQQKKVVRRGGKRGMDVFDSLAINPINEYKNFSIMSEYMTDMGRIKHSNETGLRPVNQRRIAKAIRRAIGIGIMPSVHKHPEILQLTRRY